MLVTFQLGYKRTVALAHCYWKSQFHLNILCMHGLKINKEAPDVDHLATAYGHSLLVTYPFKFESDTCAYALYVYFTIATHAIAQT